MTEYATIFDYRTSLGFDVLRGMLPLGASAIWLCVFRFRKVIAAVTLPSEQWVAFVGLVFLCLGVVMVLNTVISLAQVWYCDVTRRYEIVEGSITNLAVPIRGHASTSFTIAGHAFSVPPVHFSGCLGEDQIAQKDLHNGLNVQTSFIGDCIFRLRHKMI
jgi:hypothetical protein